MRELATRPPAPATRPEYRAALSDRLAKMQKLFSHTAMNRAGMTQDDMERLITELSEMRDRAREMEGAAIGRSVPLTVHAVVSKLHAAEQLIAVSRTALMGRIGEDTIDPNSRISAQLSDAVALILGSQAMIADRDDRT